MADQDFKINIKTLADLTGIKLTEQQLKALQTAAEQGNQKAIAALRQLSAAQKEAQSAQTTGFTGGLVGIGTFVSLVTGAINAVKRFNDEEMKVVEAAIKTQEKMRELGDSIVGIQDDAIHARYLGLLPLNVQLIELQKDFARLKTEQSLLNLPKQGEDWKNYQKQLNGVATAIKRVTGALQEQDKQNAAAAEKAAEKEFKERESFLAGAIGSSSEQTKAVLRNELAAQKARDEGREKDAALYEKSAQQLEKSMTQAQRDELEGLRAATRPPPIGRKAGVGESQDLVDQIELNKFNADVIAHGGKPMTPQQYRDFNLVEEIKDLGVKFDKLFDLWR